MTGDDKHRTDADVRADASLRGRRAYEASVRACPTYHDGTPRKAWDALPDHVKWTWERVPRTD
jgi:hypothetical protein